MQHPVLECEICIWQREIVKWLTRIPNIRYWRTLLQFDQDRGIVLVDQRYLKANRKSGKQPRVAVVSERPKYVKIWSRTRRLWVSLGAPSNPGGSFDENLCPNQNDICPTIKQIELESSNRIAFGVRSVKRWMVLTYEYTKIWSE